MFKWLVTVLLSFWISTCFAFFELEESSIELGGSARIDCVDWCISGPGGVPNILSELTWENLDICQVEGQLKALTCRVLFS